MIGGSIQATRVIGCEFAMRKVRALIVPYAIGAVFFAGLTSWLLTISRWWILLALPVYTAIILGALILVAAVTSVQLFRGELSAQQSASVSQFVDKIERVADGLQVGPFWVLFRVVYDIIWPRKQSFILQMSRDSSSLHTDFLHLQKQF